LPSRKVIKRRSADKSHKKYILQILEYLRVVHHSRPSRVIFLRIFLLMPSTVPIINLYEWKLRPEPGGVGRMSQIFRT
jgi:hypothetical protein